jgi:putative aldouronate transport system substrate-binding protein
VLNYRGETQNMLLTGLSGSSQHHTNTYVALREQMDEKQPGSELQMYYWGKEINNVTKDLITHGAMAVYQATKNVEKALQMYDLLRNDKQIYLLFNHGIEGSDYIVGENGTFSRPEGYDLIAGGLGTNFWGGRMDEFEPVWDTWWSGRLAFMEYLGNFAREYPLGKFVFDNSNVSVEMGALGEVISTRFPAIYFGKTGNPVRAVDDFRAALVLAGYDKVKAEIQSQLNELKARQGAR